MADTVVLFDPVADAGLKFGSPLVRAEIAEIAPSTVEAGSITETKLADGAVTLNKIGDGAVSSVKIASGGVAAVNLATDSVTESKIDDGAVTLDKAGVGVARAVNSDDDAMSLTFKVLTSLQYAALLVADPNTVYLIV